MSDDATTISAQQDVIEHLRQLIELDLAKDVEVQRLRRRDDGQLAALARQDAVIERLREREREAAVIIKVVVEASQDQDMCAACGNYIYLPERTHGDDCAAVRWLAALKETP